MADLTTALRTRLLEDETLVDLLADSGSVYPDEVPEGKPLPAVSYEVLADRRLSTADGHSTLREARVQFDAFADSRARADRIGREIERILGGVSGTLKHTREPNSGAVDVDDCQQDNSYSRRDPPRAGASTPVARRVVDFVIGYQNDAVPQTSE